MKKMRSKTAVTWLTFGCFLIGWLLSMALLTVMNAQQILFRLNDYQQGFLDQVMSVGTFEYYFDANDPMYTLRIEHPDHFDRAMLQSIDYTMNSYANTHNVPEYTPILMSGYAYPVDSAVLYYDAKGNLLHKNSDFLYFNYYTQEEWEAGMNNASALHSGWIDLVPGKNAENWQGDPYGWLRVMYHGTHSLYNIRALKITGSFDGTELKPATIAYVTGSAIYAMLEEMGEFQEYYDEDGTQVQEFSYDVSDLDRRGLITWEEREIGLADGELVTVYVERPDIVVYDGESVKIKGQNYESLTAWAESQNLPKNYEVFRYNSDFLSLGETNLLTLRVITGIAVRDWTGWEETSENEPPVEFYLVTATQSHPLLCALQTLKYVYLCTFAVTMLAAAMVLNKLKKKLVYPVELVSQGMAEGWTNIPRELTEDRFWREGEDLVEGYEAELHSRRGSQNELNRLNTALDYANTAERNRREMVSAVAHELKTPLAIVHGYAEGLQEHIAEAKKDEYLKIILSETERMDAMVLQMLDLSRLEAGKVKLSVDEFDLTALTKAELEKFAVLIEEKKLQIYQDFPATCTMTADEGRICQVVENLIANAVRYTPEGGQIILTIRSYKHETEFRIENSGSHFTDEQRSKIWDTFYRGDSSRSSKGTGLGLAIVKNIISLHGGSVDVRNTDLGVAFRFTLKK